MRVPLDECLPRKLKGDLVGHETRTVPEMGWAGVENGALLRRAAGRFDIFVTVDRNIEHQQNLEALGLGVVVLAARSNDIDDLRPLLPRVLEVLDKLQPGLLVVVGDRLEAQP